MRWFQGFSLGLESKFISPRWGLFEILLTNDPGRCPLLSHDAPCGAVTMLTQLIQQKNE